MASLAHIAVGMAAARVSEPHPTSRRAFAAAMVGWTALSLLPDLDVIGFRFGVSYGDPWGHRGVTHSLAFAVGVGLCVALTAGPAGRSRLRLGALAVAVVAGHGLLDTLTDGGLGAALLWPFDDTRWFAPWRPIPVAPIGLGLLSMRGLEVAAAELVGFAPLFAYALWPRGGRR